MNPALARLVSGLQAFDDQLARFVLAETEFDLQLEIKGAAGRVVHVCMRHRGPGTDGIPARFYQDRSLMSVTRAVLLDMGKSDLMGRVERTVDEFDQKFCQAIAEQLDFTIKIECGGDAGKCLLDVKVWDQR